RIEEFQVYSKDVVVREVVENSNQEFEKLDDIQNYINKKDAEWTSAPEEEITPFMQELMNNKSSKVLKEKIEFYEEKCGYKVLGEIFITNKYGVNAAQTGKTSDYYQADEDWWQNAKKDGFYVGDVEYDKSADVYSTAIGVRIDDENGNFIGVVKAVLNIEEVTNILKKIEATKKYAATEFKLITKSGKIIYSTEDFRPFEDVSEELFSSFEQKGEHIEYFIAEGDKPGEGEELFVHTHSKGYGGYKGLGWILIVEHKTEEIFAPVARLKNSILIISAVVTALTVLMGLLISHSISRPVSKLSSAIIEIGKGGLDTRVEVESNDEIGQLAASFNDMAGKLKESHTKLQKSHAQLDKKVKERTAELSSANTKLEGEVSHRAQAQNILEERIKELNCLFGLSKLVEQPEITTEQIFQQTTELIRNAYRYPDLTCVRITFNGVHYKTDNFDKSELSQHSEIKLRGEIAGEIEVYYVGEKAGSDEGSFLKEERDLLDAVAKHLGRIAERKQAGEKLQLFRGLIDRANDAIFVIEPQWGRLLDVNDRTCQSLGYSREELLDMSVKDIDEIIRDDSCWLEYVKELKQKGSMILEGLYRRKDGTTFPAEVNAIFTGQEKANYVIAVARDITERKSAEERQAQLLEEVESINQELKDFAYIVSHDLKAPLRGIKILADWIVADYADKIDEEGKEQMNQLTKRVDRMHNLIEGVLTYSRVGRVKEGQVRVNLNELVPDIIDMIAPPENIAITIENELPVVECEQTRIGQVFQNLLSNAVKYMDKPQGRINIGCVEEDGFWEFSVSDNGPGIEEKYFEKIFKMFQTLSPRDEFESTGVGLAVVKKIVELYGGKIRVKSKPGEGSTFFFTLPKQNLEVKNDAELEANIIS
ncbi:MAG TPA: ATP-binding protein, partial [Desulfatiglandales bacterium]|nr:ATP-binding protein [Desulfatiglandales bacterium]